MRAALFAALFASFGRKLVSASNCESYNDDGICSSETYPNDPDPEVSLLQHDGVLLSSVPIGRHRSGDDDDEAAGPLAPGEPGAQWSPLHIQSLRAKLVALMERGDSLLWEANIQVPGERWASIPDPAKLVRLGFHDCLKYKDGSGGCDGCLEWNGVGTRFDRGEMGKFKLKVEDDGHNNGLMPTVMLLERIYTDGAFPSGAVSMTRSFQDLGLSRADLWAFAAQIAIEYTIDLNNRLCKRPVEEPPLFGQCHPRVGEADCEITPRKFTFKSGRRDCIPDPDFDAPYKTKKEESHPDPGHNGEATFSFFKKDFGFNARESVAILGAHTLGRMHNTISHHQYTWKARSGKLFNNGYYRNLAAKEDWYYPSNMQGDCRGFGNATGGRPVARWKPHAFSHFETGAPVQWLQEKFVCPCFNEEWTRPPAGCCTDVKNACAEGCETYRIVLGIDETMLNSDMGLYVNFSTNDGIPTGCPGLENYNAEAFKQHWGFRVPRVPIDDPDGDEWDWKNCGKNEFRDPSSDKPVHEIVEDYANDNDKFLDDFFPTYERMLSNGYAATELSNLSNMPPYHCGGTSFFTCFDIGTLSTPFFIVSAHDQRVLYQDDSGTLKLGLAARVRRRSGLDSRRMSQLWHWTAEGNVLVNSHTKMPLVADGIGQWKFRSQASWWRAPPGYKVLSWHGRCIDRGWGQHDLSSVHSYNCWGGPVQHWFLKPA